MSPHGHDQQPGKLTSPQPRQSQQAAVTAGTGQRASRAARVSRATMTAVLAGLPVQFLLGMYLNLYVPHLHGQAPLAAHIVLGTVLVAAGLAALIFAVLSRRLDHMVVSILGAAALGFAWRGGISFLTAGGHSIDSYLMATGFICAVTFYAAGLFTVSRRDTRTRAR